MYRTKEWTKSPNLSHVKLNTKKSTTPKTGKDSTANAVRKIIQQKQSSTGHLNRRSRVSEPQLRRAAVGAVLDDSGGGDGAVDEERGAPGVGRGGSHVGGGGRRPHELRRQARHRGARAGCLARLTGVPSPLLPGGKMEGGDGGDGIHVCSNLSR